jgi:hypothetical protein
MNYKNIEYKYRVHKLSEENFDGHKEATRSQKRCILAPVRGGDK